VSTMTSNRSIISEFVAVQAERKLKEVAQALCLELKPQDMEDMARKNLTLEQLLHQTGHKIPKVSLLNKPGVDHLAHLSDEKILALLEQVVPDHVAVLRRHPVFSRSVTRDLKAFAKG